MRTRIVLALTYSIPALTLLPGCLWWNHVVVPPAPTPVIGSDPGAIAYEHDVEVSWRATDLDVLQSLSLSFPGKISILQDPTATELTLQLQIYIQKDNQDSLASAYTNQILTASTLNVVNAVFNVPPPIQTCQETQDAQGNVTALQGICPVQMTVIVPTSHPVPISAAPGGDFESTGATLPSLQLTVVDGTHTSISQFTGALKITGGGPKAIIQVNTATSLDLELTAIEEAQLQHISSQLHIALANPNPADPSEVTVDGKPITTFPFDSP